ncbi:MAG: cytochrome c biogenesis protein ResB [Bacteroidetes bacterium]|nr:cytochrome c biogenesis protein ResB [Bacteroidota bacterium]
MKNVLNLIYSTTATLWLLLLFAISMATATFVEDRYDTETAYRYIYGAKWFEIVIALLALNFIGNIHRYNLLSKKKFAGFVFHAAFIVMILGAAITRYFGYEGLMHIREGQSSNVIVMPNQVLKIMAIDHGKDVSFDIPLNLMDTSSDLSFKKSIDTESGDLTISYKKLLQNATETLVENIEGGVDCIKLNVLDNGTESDVIIADKEIAGTHTFKMSYKR